jgi:hypothetical protein
MKQKYPGVVERCFWMKVAEGGGYVRKHERKLKFKHRWIGHESIIL